MRCLDFEECSGRADFAIWLWLMSTMCSFILSSKEDQFVRYMKYHKSKEFCRHLIVGGGWFCLSLMWKIVWEFCSCSTFYIGQTDQSFETRINEHIADTNHNRIAKSALTEHSSKSKHLIHFDQTQILVRDPTTPLA